MRVLEIHLHIVNGRGGLPEFLLPPREDEILIKGTIVTDEAPHELNFRRIYRRDDFISRFDWIWDLIREDIKHVVKEMNASAET